MVKSLLVEFLWPYDNIQYRLTSEAILPRHTTSAFAFARAEKKQICSKSFYIKKLDFRNTMRTCLVTKLVKMLNVLLFGSLQRLMI